MKKPKSKVKKGETMRLIKWKRDVKKVKRWEVQKTEIMKLKKWKRDVQGGVMMGLKKIKRSM